MEMFALEGSPNEDPNDIEGRAIERRDAEWVAIIEEIRKEIDDTWTADGEMTAAKWAVGQVKTRMIEDTLNGG